LFGLSIGKLTGRLARLVHLEYASPTRANLKRRYTKMAKTPVKKNSKLELKSGKKANKIATLNFGKAHG